MNQPFFIAEVSSNHHQDPERCFAFIDKAAEIGCWGVKFQLFRIDQLFAPEVLARSQQHRARRRWELPCELIPELAVHCHKRGIAFGCSPFDLEAVEQLKPHVAFFKIASYELPWTALLSAVGSSGLPVILSTGMADMDEVVAAVATLREAGCSKPTLLHCSSAYPTPAAEVNLAAIETMARATGLDVGWSDHTRSPAVIYRAIHRWGARIIEFHLDLDGQGAEYQAGHCWLPQDIKAVIETVTTGFSADGHGRKQPNPSELPDRMWRTDPQDGLRPMKAIRHKLEL